MGDLLQGFLPIAAVGAVCCFVMFVWSVAVKDKSRRPDDTDNAGAEEGARINHREVTK